MTESTGDPRVARTPDLACTCPACGSSDLIPILYGLPGPDMVDADRAGEIVIGGCLARDEAWRCRECGIDSEERSQPARFAVWDEDSTDEQIAEWVLGQSTAAADEEATASATEAANGDPEDSEEPSEDEVERRGSDTLGDEYGDLASALAGEDPVDWDLMPPEDWIDSATEIIYRKWKPGEREALLRIVQKDDD